MLCLRITQLYARPLTPTLSPSTRERESDELRSDRANTARLRSHVTKRSPDKHGRGAHATKVRTITIPTWPRPRTSALRALEHRVRTPPAFPRVSERGMGGLAALEAFDEVGDLVNECVLVADLAGPAPTSASCRGDRCQ